LHGRGSKQLSHSLCVQLARVDFPRNTQHYVIQRRISLLLRRDAHPARFFNRNAHRHLHSGSRRARLRDFERAPLGNLTGSGSDIFTGIPIAWLSNTSIADYVAATPAGSNSTVVITSSTLSYYSGLVYYPNYTTDFTAGTVTTQSNGSFYATYGHSSEFDSFIVAISGLFPLLVAVAVLLLVWRIGVYWEKTGT
jgi:hypothetical protein